MVIETRIVVQEVVYRMEDAIPRVFRVFLDQGGIFKIRAPRNRQRGGKKAKAKAKAQAAASRPAQDGPRPPAASPPRCSSAPTSSKGKNKGKGKGEKKARWSQQSWAGVASAPRQPLRSPTHPPAQVPKPKQGPSRRHWPARERAPESQELAQQAPSSSRHNILDPALHRGAHVADLLRSVANLIDGDRRPMPAYAGQDSPVLLLNAQGRPF